LPSGGRQHAETEAMEAARALRMSQVAALLVGTSPRPNPIARRMAPERALRAAAVCRCHRLVDASRRSGVSGRLNWDWDGRDWPNHALSRSVKPAACGGTGGCQATDRLYC
jgi:hypothetical protein